MKNQLRYIASVHINANKDNVEFIGEVKANSIEKLKELARKLAILNNKHLYGRLCISLEGKDLFINP